MEEKTYYKDNFNGDIFYIDSTYESPYSYNLIIVLVDENGESFEVSESDFHDFYYEIGTKREIRNKKLDKILGNN